MSIKDTESQQVTTLRCTLFGHLVYQCQIQSSEITMPKISKAWSRHFCGNEQVQDSNSKIMVGQGLKQKDWHEKMNVLFYRCLAHFVRCSAWLNLSPHSHLFETPFDFSEKKIQTLPIYLASKSTYLDKLVSKILSKELD